MVRRPARGGIHETGKPCASLMSHRISMWLLLSPPTDLFIFKKQDLRSRNSTLPTSSFRRPFGSRTAHDSLRDICLVPCTGRGGERPIVCCDNNLFYFKGNVELDEVETLVVPSFNVVLSIDNGKVLRHK